jgi:hypothetical protein
MSGASGLTARLERVTRYYDYNPILPRRRLYPASFDRRLARPASEQFGHFRFQSIDVGLRGLDHRNVRR